METQNLVNKEAISKLRAMVDSIGTAMLLTRLDTLPISANPMAIRKVDENGTLYFLSELQSEHNLNILLNQKVQLIFNEPSKNQYPSVFGNATMKFETEILKDLYTEEDDNWFAGYDDPNLTALKIIPQQVFYWDRSPRKHFSLLEGVTENVNEEKKQKDVKGKLVV